MVHKFSLSLCTLNVEELIWKVNKWDGAPCNIKITDISMWKTIADYMCVHYHKQLMSSILPSMFSPLTYVGDIKFISRVTVLREFLLTALSVSLSECTRMEIIQISLHTFSMLLKEFSRCTQNWVKLRSETVDAIRKRRKKAKLMISLFT